MLTQFVMLQHVLALGEYCAVSLLYVMNGCNENNFRFFFFMNSSMFEQSMTINAVQINDALY